MHILIDELRQLRTNLDKCFSPDTAAPRSKQVPPSSGHCAVVAKIIRDRFGGDLVSTYIKANCHWFNRLYINGESIDVDLTGDQFGFPALNISVTEPLYKPSIKRNPDDLGADIIKRSAILLARVKVCENETVEIIMDI